MDLQRPIVSGKRVQNVSNLKTRRVLNGQRVPRIQTIKVLKMASGNTVKNVYFIKTSNGYFDVYQFYSLTSVFLWINHRAMYFCFPGTMCLWKPGMTLAG